MLLALNFFTEKSSVALGKNICIPFHPKVATRTNFSEHFAAAKAEMGYKNFPRLTISVGLAIYAWLRRVQVCKLFFYSHHDLRGGELRRISRVRVKSRASRTSREAWKGWAKALQENTTKRRLRTPMGRIKWEGKKWKVADRKDVSSRVSLT